MGTEPTAAQPGSSGWAQLPADAADSAGPAAGAAQRALTNGPDNSSAVAIQNLRAMIALQRTQQFNAYVATYKLQQYAAAAAAQQAAARAAQAAAAAAAAAAAPPSAAPAAPPPPSPAPSGGSPGVWAELRQCESGGDYAEDSGNGYYGAYQFALGTWQSLGYGGLPSQAAPAVQDQAAQRLQARSGWGQWPACAAKLGLL